MEPLKQTTSIEVNLGINPARYTRVNFSNKLDHLKGRIITGIRAQSAEQIGNSTSVNGIAYNIASADNLKSLLLTLRKDVSRTILSEHPLFSLNDLANAGGNGAKVKIYKQFLLNYVDFNNSYIQVNKAITSANPLLVKFEIDFI